MYSELDIKNIVKTVSNTQDGFDFICMLLDEFGTFDTRINFSNSDTKNICLQIKKEQGEFILNLLKEYNFEKFIEVHRKRINERCLKTLN